MKEIKLQDIQPYIRYVNNYKPTYSYVEQERIIYDYEFMYVMEGEVEMHYDGVIYTLKKGDIFYLKPFVKNHIVVEENKGFRTHCIHFDWMPPTDKEDFTAEEFYMRSVTSKNYYEKLEQLKCRINYEPSDFSLPNYIGGIDNKKLGALFTQSYYAFSDYSMAAKLRVKALFIEIVVLLLEQYGCDNVSNLVHPKIKKSIKYLQDNFKQDIPVPWLAKKYNLSPKYFGSLFKIATGKTVSEFILDLRINDAKDMLIRTDMTIEEVSERVGFNNSFYFSKCFKEKEKIAPSEFRNMMRLNN